MESAAGADARCIAAADRYERRNLRPAISLRLDQIQQRLRAALGRRGSETIAWLAIGGTLVAMLLTAHQVRQGWSQREVAAERALRDQLSSAAALIGSEAVKMSSLELRALLWPVLGTNGLPHAAGLTLDAFARAGAEQFAVMGDDRGTARPGYFRLVRRSDGAWTTANPELRGALATDSAYARTVLDGVQRWAGGFDIDQPDIRIGVIRPGFDGVPLEVAMAIQRAGGGRAVALFGVAYARNVALRTHVGHVLQGVRLLQAPGAPNDSTNGGHARMDNAALAVRLVYPTGFRDPVSRAAMDDGVQGSAYSATRAIEGRDGGFTVEVAVPERIGKAYVAAAMPSKSERLTFGGVLLLGVGFAAAVAVGLRRQYRLAEARRTFVAAVSHELRTPLAHVTMLSETLLLGRAESPEQAQRWLRAIHREGRRLSVLTENVLLHARGEQRGIRVSPQWTDVVAVVHDAVSLVEAHAQARAARIVIAGNAVDDSSGSTRAWVDSAALGQIVINFIENALKFGPEGQTVVVTLDVGRVATAGNDEGWLRLHVDDEGPGVPRVHRERIWQPFVRVTDGGRAPAGTGLGLSVVRQLVAELGGHCSVSEAPCGGARFSVELPITVSSVSHGAELAEGATAPA